MTAGPLVSIIIPTYNRATLVTASLDSALKQTIAEHEIIVVDDGSTDNTLTVLGPYQDRIRYFYQENRGLSGARNTGIRHARGEWLAFLDSDDLWEPDRVASILEFARQHPDAGCINTGRRILRADGTPTDKIYSWRGCDCYIEPHELLMGVRPGCGMVRRELAERLQGFDEDIPASEDLDFCLRLSQHARLAEIGRPLLLQRVHGRTLSRNHQRTALGRFRILEKLEREQPEFVRKHAPLVRKLRAGAHSRMGRALLTDPQALRQREAIEHFKHAARLEPFNLRHWRYWLIARYAAQWYRRKKS